MQNLTLCYKYIKKNYQDKPVFLENKTKWNVILVREDALEKIKNVRLCEFFLRVFLGPFAS